ncbi:hypothetical protein C1645_822565 [Glomus cerebriforme]|uniref:Uncharacterized protein n=1 Tax=Glomus cerebriforme TaxID=658196 RepID=A0A397T7J8_9GLOM|nr:hypothetical protein C1645_822565 [Glomus cerebriforme]
MTVWGTEQTTSYFGKKPDYKEESKKRKKDQEDEEEDEGIDDLAILYNKLIVEIETARENQMACLITPLYWGVIDLKAKNVSPYPKYPRTKEFLSDTEVQNLQQMVIKIINKESYLSLSVKYFWRYFDVALSVSENLVRRRGLRELKQGINQL